MKVTFLGTGTSHGVPMIGCDCPICRSEDPRDKRTRSSVLIEAGDAKLLIDTTPELRIQVLRENVRHIDAVLFTHAHADHVFGLDDVRRFNDLGGRSMPCYGNPQTLATIRRAFEYVFVPTQLGGGKPSLDLIPVDGEFTVKDVLVQPVKVMHGTLHILGYRIGGFGYVTDVSRIPEDSMSLLGGLDVLTIGVIRHQPHETHFCISQALEIIDKLRPKRAFFTHIAHRLGHEVTEAELPSHIRLAYDGLQVTL